MCGFQPVIKKANLQIAVLNSQTGLRLYLYGHRKQGKIAVRSLDASFRCLTINGNMPTSSV